MAAAHAVCGNVSNKVLPGDKSGLPWEIWQYLLSWMSADELCRLACVCKTWSDLVASVDSTRWKQLYMACSEWRHPFWPLNTSAEPSSWRLAYRDQYIATKLWRQRRLHEAKNISCSMLFQKTLARKTVHVGPGLEHESLKSALAMISEYDRVVVHPGIYDELFEISSKIPFELIGAGELGSIILVVGIQQVGTSARLSNLVLRNPWFTSFIVTINSGFLQVDSCILEDGMLCAQNPATVHIKFCTFRHATIILQHMNTSVIENCEFSQSDSANVIIEGYPKEEKNWTFGFLRERTNAVFSQRSSLHRKKRGLKTSGSLTSSTVQSSVTGKSMAPSGIGCGSSAGTSTTFGQQHVFDAMSGEPSFSLEDPGLSFLHPRLSTASRHIALQPDSTGMVGCGDLQALYHDGSSACAEGEEQGASTSNVLATHKRSSSLPTPGAITVGGRLRKDVDKEKVEIVEQGDNASEKKKIHQNIKSVLVQSSEEPIDLSDMKSPLDYEQFAFENHSNDEKREKSTTSRVRYVSMNSTENVEGLQVVDIATMGVNEMTDNAESVQDEPRPDLGIGKTSIFEFEKNSSSLLCRRKQAKRRQVIEHWDSSPENSVSGACNSQGKTQTNDLPPMQAKDFLSSPTQSNKNLSNNQSLLQQLSHQGFAEMTQSTSSANPSSVSMSRGDSLTFATTQQSYKQLLTASQPCLSVEQTDGQKSQGSSQAISKSIPLLVKHASTIDVEVQSHAHSSGPSTSKSNIVCRHGRSPPPDYHPYRSTTSGIHAHPSSHHHHHHKHHHHGPNQDLDNDMEQNGGLPPLRIPIRRSQSQELDGVVSDDDLSILDELEDSDGTASDGGGSENHEDGSDNSTTDSSSLASSLHFSDTEGGFSSSEESVIMLPHLREFHPVEQQEQSTTSPRGVQAEVASINSDCTRPVPVDVSEDSLMSSYVGHIQGCLIHQCRMNHSKGGLMISLQAHAIVSECDISNVGYGIRCIQNSRAVILKNKFHHCRTSAIFMRLSASGLIAGNDIHSNNEAGIDIRKNADPLVQFNQIHHGKRSGIVVLGSGRGQIKKNDIYRNQEAGVYVLYGGNPTISENYIYEGKAAGVAINAGGKGCIVDNVIRGNQWGGLDIRNGSCPLVAGNSIINGLSDGVVVGLGGRGIIESNLISGNGGCGLWMMAAKHLYVHGNQICNNIYSGVMLLDRSASAMEGQLSHIMNALPHNDLHEESHQIPVPAGTSGAVLQYNNIYNNGGYGIVVDIKEEVRMMYNTVYGNHRDGVLMSQMAPAVLDGNSISCNCGNGVVTSTHEQIQLTGNGIYDNGQHGLVVRTDCAVERNDIAGHTRPSVFVEAGVTVKLHDNRLCPASGCTPAVLGEESAVVEAVDNKIYDRGGGIFRGFGRILENNNEVHPSTPNHRRDSKGEFKKTDYLKDPPPRPHIVPPPPSTVIPTHHVTVVTKVTMPSRESCEQGSKFCVIL